MTGGGWRKRNQPAREPPVRRRAHARTDSRTSLLPQASRPLAETIGVPGGVCVRASCRRIVATLFPVESERRFGTALAELDLHFSLLACVSICVCACVYVCVSVRLEDPGNQEHSSFPQTGVHPGTSSVEMPGILVSEVMNALYFQTWLLCNVIIKFRRISTVVCSYLNFHCTLARSQAFKSRQAAAVE